MKTTLLLMFLLWVLAYFVQAQEPALFPVKKNDKAGYIDQTGKVVIPLKFDEAWGFAEGLAPVRVGEDWGYTNKKGEIVIKPQFFQADSFSEGIASVGIYWPRRKIIDATVGYYGYVDKNGRVITKDKFDVAFDFSNGLAMIQTEDSKDGFIDHTGKIVLYFDAWSGFSNDRAMFKTNSNMPDSKIGYIDKTGNVVIPAQYHFGTNFLEGLACVSKEKGFGYIDTEGNTKIDFVFDGCDVFSEGLAAVRVDGKYGFIDESGKMVIEPQFAEVRPFSDGAAIVRIGEPEKPTEDGLRDVTITPERNMTVAKDGVYGVIDKTGKFIIPPRFVQIGSFYDGLAWVNLSDSYLVHGETDQWGYVNKKGVIVWKSF